MNKNTTSTESVVGKILLIAIFLYCFFNFEDMITVERIQETRAKNKLLTVFLHWLGQNEVGYYVGKGIFLLVPLLIIWRLISDLRK